jgi:hypothetical protein
MKCLAASLFAAVVLASSAFAAEDHLAPEDSPYLDIHGTEITLSSVKPFQAAIGQDAEAWVFSGGGLAPLVVLGVRRRNGRQVLFKAEYGFGRNPKVRVRDVPISEVLAQKIISVWRKMLRQTAFAPPPTSMPTDVPVYHFALVADWLSGRMTDPQTPKLDRLEQIVEDMRVSFDYDKKRGLPVLERDVDDLLRMQ